MKFNKLKTTHIIEIVDKYKMIPDFYKSAENRKCFINELNETFFPDNIAKFIDYTSITGSGLSLMIEYKNERYNILAYKTDVRKKVDRIRKLRNLENENR